ncbi:hypothetical protein [Oryza sativa Japonica Group]|uniref:Uncharacterized protein n=2 Tax=Oryza sativa subsp. japonica TaxID=39947 RepID=Q5QLL5_ORYSJ|nr:hypothetical protein [Oryza sativa Japonica Group]BAD73693.1 hypothetical protein [Oryza sativa Japonica Group]
MGRDGDGVGRRSSGCFPFYRQAARWRAGDDKTTGDSEGTRVRESSGWNGDETGVTRGDVAPCLPERARRFSWSLARCGFGAACGAALRGPGTLWGAREGGMVQREIPLTVVTVLLNGLSVITLFNCH